MHLLNMQYVPDSIEFNLALTRIQNNGNTMFGLLQELWAPYKICLQNYQVSITFPFPMSKKSHHRAESVELIGMCGPMAWLGKKANTSISTWSGSPIDNDITLASDVDSDVDDSIKEAAEVNAEKELGMLNNQSHFAYLTFPVEVAKHTWRSPIYSFFQSSVSVQYHNGHLCHFFHCAARKCKARVGGVCHFQDSKDKSSTANLRHHTIWCFGEDTVNDTMLGKTLHQSNGLIFASFARQGQKPVNYSYCLHNNTEVR